MAFGAGSGPPLAAVLGALRRRASGWWSQPFGERAVSIAMIAMAAWGIWFRSRGFLDSTLPLWLDEASWAVMLIELPLREHIIRPIGFMAVSKAMVGLFSASEASLRALPWLAGVLAPCFAPSVAARLFRSPLARLLFVGIIALHPAAIDLSKEFKPYSVSLTFHIALLLSVLRYLGTRRAGDLLLALLVAVIGLFFAQDMVFAYPSSFLVLGACAWRQGRIRQLKAIAAAAGLIIAMLLSMYLLIWSRIESWETGYWGDKYGVFYVPDAAHPERTRLAWTLDHYQEMVVMPGMRRDHWDSSWLTRRGLARSRGIDLAIWVSLHLLGVLVIVWQRRLRDGLLLLSPLIVMGVFNRLGHWPFGEFRTNAFVLVYMAAIAAVAFDERSRRAVELRSFAPVAVLVVLPILAFEQEWHTKKLWFSSTSQAPRLIERLTETPARGSLPEALVLDDWTCDLWKYYVGYHPETRRRLGATLARRFAVSCDENGRRAKELVLGDGDRPGRPAWLVYSKWRAFHAARRGWLRKAKLGRRISIGGQHTILPAAPRE